MLAAYAAMGMGVTASRFFAEIGHERDGRDPAAVGYAVVPVAIACGGLHLLPCLLLPAEWLSAGLAVPRWMLALGVFVLAAGVVPVARSLA